MTKRATKESEIIRQQTCTRCQHSWFPKSPGRPTVCPKCRSPRWDLPPRRRVKAE